MRLFCAFSLLFLFAAALPGCAPINQRLEHASVGPRSEAALSMLYEAPPADVRAALRSALRDSLALDVAAPGEAGALRAEHRGEHFRARLAVRTAPASAASRDTLWAGARTRVDVDFTYWRRTGGAFTNFPMRLHSAAARLLDAPNDRRKRERAGVRLLPQPPSPDSATCQHTREEEDGSESKETITLDQAPRLIGGAPALYEQLRYPTYSRFARQEGQVVVQFVVGERGAVSCADVVMGVSRRLNASALSAVRAQRFEPGRVDGEAVALRMLLPVTFRLQ